MDEAWEAWARPQRFEGRLDLLWREVRGALAADPSDDDLCRLAVETLEPLIDLYWPAAIDEFEAMALQQPRLRRALSCCCFDDAVPELIQARVARLIRPEDDIGSMTESS
jgi:hypothetical protein